MDKVEKLLRKIDKKDSYRIVDVLKRVLKDDLSTLDVKKLKNYKDIFRVRVGDYRIIYRKTDSDIKLLEISRRTEDTYSNY